MANDEIIDNELVFDDEFIAELDLRNKEMIEGTVRTYTWEETKLAAIESVRLKKSIIDSSPFYRM